MKKYYIFVICIFVYSLAIYSAITVTNNEELVYLGGDAIGIKLLATGVLVVDVDRNDVDIKVSDVILKVNGNKIETNKELLNYGREGKELELEIDRKGKIIYTKIIPKLDKDLNEYKLGLYVKDSSAGVGTLSFYTNERFAALGHGITETKENIVLPIDSGAITRTSILSIKKGLVNDPGYIKGTITNDIYGDIYLNTSRGIYGKVKLDLMEKDKTSYAIASKKEVKTGKALVYVTLDDMKKKEYEIVIDKIIQSEETKNMIIRIKDKELLNITGGIIQGMSGSPIIQNGKIVGVVTHVLASNPTKGYGVFAESMYKDMIKFN